MPKKKSKKRSKRKPVPAKKFLTTKERKKLANDRQNDINKTDTNDDDDGLSILDKLKKKGFKIGPTLNEECNELKDGNDNDIKNKDDTGNINDSEITFKFSTKYIEDGISDDNEDCNGNQDNGPKIVGEILKNYIDCEINYNFICWDHDIYCSDKNCGKIHYSNTQALNENYKNECSGNDDVKLDKECQNIRNIVTKTKYGIIVIHFGNIKLTDDWLLDAQMNIFQKIKFEIFNEYIQLKNCVNYPCLLVRIYLNNNQIRNHGLKILDIFSDSIFYVDLIDLSNNEIDNVGVNILCNYYSNKLRILPRITILNNNEFNKKGLNMIINCVTAHNNKTGFVKSPMKFDFYNELRKIWDDITYKNDPETFNFSTVNDITKLYIPVSFYVKKNGFNEMDVEQITTLPDTPLICTGIKLSYIGKGNCNDHYCAYIAQEIDIYEENANNEDFIHKKLPIMHLMMSEYKDKKVSNNNGINKIHIRREPFPMINIFNNVWDYNENKYNSIDTDKILIRIHYSAFDYILKNSWINERIKQGFKNRLKIKLNINDRPIKKLVTLIYDYTYIVTDMKEQELTKLIAYSYQQWKEWIVNEFNDIEINDILIHQLCHELYTYDDIHACFYMNKYYKLSDLKKIFHHNVNKYCLRWVKRQYFHKTSHMDKQKRSTLVSNILRYIKLNFSNCSVFLTKFDINKIIDRKAKTLRKKGWNYIECDKTPIYNIIQEMNKIKNNSNSKYITNMSLLSKIIELYSNNSDNKFTFNMEQNIIQYLRQHFKNDKHRIYSISKCVDLLKHHHFIKDSHLNKDSISRYNKLIIIYGYEYWNNFCQNNRLNDELNIECTLIPIQYLHIFMTKMCYKHNNNNIFSNKFMNSFVNMLCYFNDNKVNIPLSNIDYIHNKLYMN